MSETKAYCEEILNQLKWAGAGVFMSWGPSQFLNMGDNVGIVTDEKGTTRTIKCRACLRFNVNGAIHKGLVYVVLTGLDDYTILLVKVKRGDHFGTIVKEVEGIYCDELAATVDRLVETAK